MEGAACPILRGSALALCWQQLLEPVEQRRQVILDDPPDEVVVDGGVAVHENVSEADDAWELVEFCGGGWIDLGELVERFADDPELSLDR